MNLTERIEALFVEGEDVLKNNPTINSISYAIKDVSLEEFYRVGVFSPYLIGNTLKRNIFHPTMPDKISVQIITVPVKLKSELMYEEII